MATHRRAHMSGKTYRGITIVEKTEAEDSRQRSFATYGLETHPTTRKSPTDAAGREMRSGLLQHQRERCQKYRRNLTRKLAGVRQMATNARTGAERT